MHTKTRPLCSFLYVHMCASRICTHHVLPFPCCTYRHGNCVPFKIHEQGTPCDVFFTPGVDYVYIPYQRGGGNLDRYLNYIEIVGQLISSISHRCLEPASKVLCHYYLPPCGNSSVFEPPTSVCAEECKYVAETCSTVWEQLTTFIETYKNIGQRYGLTTLNCSNTGEYLFFESYSVCCSDVGIDIRMFMENTVIYCITV